MGRRTFAVRGCPLHFSPLAETLKLPATQGKRIPWSICCRSSFDGLAMSGLTTWTTVFVAVSLGLHLWAGEGPQKKGGLLGEVTPNGSRVRRSCVAGAGLMALLCLANTPLPAPWVQWLEGEPERLPVRLQTPYVAGSGPAPNGEFVPPAAAVAAAASATGMAVSNELGRHSSAAVGGGSVPVGGAAALQQAGAVGAAAAAAGAARNASGSAGSTGLGAAAAAENITAKLENVRYPTITLSRSSPSREHLVGKSTFFSRTRTLTPSRYSGRPSLLRKGAPPEAMRLRHCEPRCLRRCAPRRWRRLRRRGPLTPPP